MTDGRAERSTRTREAILDATEQAVRSGTPVPSAREISDAAGIAPRTLYTHFDSVDDIYAALVARARDQILALLQPIDPDTPVEDRVHALCDQRSTIAARLGPLRRAAAIHEHRSIDLAGARTVARRASADQIRRVFRAELRSMDRPTAARCVATIDSLLTGETWDLMIDDHRLSPSSATRAIASAVLATLDAATAADTPIDRRSEAAAVAADADRRAQRLVAAIEAGAPPETIVPHLTALRDEHRRALRTATR